jgi:hypothetical protein
MSQSPNNRPTFFPIKDKEEQCHRIRRQAAVSLWGAGISPAVGFESFEQSLDGNGAIGLEPVPEIPLSLLEEWHEQNHQVALKNWEDDSGRHRSVSSNMKHDPWMLVLVEHRLPVAKLCDLLKVTRLDALEKSEIRSDTARHGQTWQLCHDGSFFRLLSPEHARERLPANGFTGLHAEDLLSMLAQHPALSISLRFRTTDIIASEIAGHPDKIVSLNIKNDRRIFSPRGIRMDIPAAIPALRRILP